MKRIELILENKIYQDCLNKIKKYEQNRIFCKHDLEHFLNMSRIAYIMVLEEELNISKELIYAVGLLHDIGRVKEYENGINHHEASIELAKEILKDCYFNKNEIDFILKAIESHRDINSDFLKNIFYKADKYSRNCIECKAKNLCNWSDEKKNLKIKY